MKLSVLAAVAAAGALAGCAGKVDYVRPAPATPIETSKVIAKPRAVVWDSAVPQLGKQFFVINNLDKSSGFINISYSGDPEKYVDCGRIISFVKNARGERTYDFPAAKMSMDYEIMHEGRELLFLSRQMNLDGRINLVFEEIGPEQTRVTATSRYVLRRDQTIRNVQGQTANRSDSVSFNSSASGNFPTTPSGGGTSCRATGALEQEVLSNIN